MLIWYSSSSLSSHYLSLNISVSVSLPGSESLYMILILILIWSESWFLNNMDPDPYMIWILILIWSGSWFLHYLDPDPYKVWNKIIGIEKQKVQDQPPNYLLWHILFRADSSQVDRPGAEPLHNGLTAFGKVKRYRGRREERHLNIYKPPGISDV